MQTTVVGCIVNRLLRHFSLYNHLDCFNWGILPKIEPNMCFFHWLPSDGCNTFYMTTAFPLPLPHLSSFSFEMFKFMNCKFRDYSSRCKKQNRLIFFEAHQGAGCSFKKLRISPELSCKSFHRKDVPLGKPSSILKTSIANRYPDLCWATIPPQDPSLENWEQWCDFKTTSLISPHWGLIKGNPLAHLSQSEGETGLSSWLGCGSWGHH